MLLKEESFTYFTGDGIGDIVTTYTGKHFDISNPKPNQICVEDIAHSLSSLVRYTGHLERFYTVAEHSILCYKLACDLNYTNLEKMYVLMHDGSESICNDVNSVLKKYLPEYKVIEQKIMDVIWEMIGVPMPSQTDYEKVKVIDNTLLIYEMISLDKRRDIPDLKIITDAVVDFGEERSRKDVKMEFLSVYYELIGNLKMEELING